MRFAALFVTSILISGIATGQSRPQRHPTPPPPTDQPSDAAPVLKPGRVEGAVISSVGGTPVKKATIVLRNIGAQFSYAAISDAAGHFAFENVQPGPYEISADSSGFMAQQPGRRSPLKQINVAEEQEVKDVAVKLIPLSSISGHVIDADGEPIARAQVQAMHYSYQMGRQQLQGSGWARASDLGEFEILDLAPGRYYVQVTAQPRIRNLPPRTRILGGEIAYPIVFYPNAAEVAQAKAVQLEPGSHIGDVDMRLQEAPAHHIRGRAAENLQNGFVTVRGRDLGVPVFSTNTRIQSDGTFDVGGLVNGTYQITVRAQTPQVMTSESVTIADQDVEGLVLTVAAGRDVTGSVKVEGPAPDSWQGARVVLFPADTIGRSSNAVIDSDSTFTLHDVQTAGYLLRPVFQIPGKYVKAVRYADREVVNGQIDLTHAGDGKLEILLGSDVGELQGTVQTAGGEPAPGALITLISKQDDRADLFKVASADQQGNYRFKDTAPGDYTVFAWQDIDTSMPQFPGFRKLFESKGVSVSIAPSGKTSSSLTMITTEEIDAEKSKLP